MHNNAQYVHNNAQFFAGERTRQEKEIGAEKRERQRACSPVEGAGWRQGWRGEDLFGIIMHHLFHHCCSVAGFDASLHHAMLQQHNILIFIIRAISEGIQKIQLQHQCIILGCVSKMQICRMHFQNSWLCNTSSPTYKF
jgi:hypothetical protein